MMPDQTTRRGFLGACSAAAAALGLSARATPSKPTPRGIEAVDPNGHALVPQTWCIQELDTATGITKITVINGGSGYTSPPSVVFYRGGGASGDSRLMNTTG